MSALARLVTQMFDPPRYYNHGAQASELLPFFPAARDGSGGGAGQQGAGPPLF